MHMSFHCIYIYTHYTGHGDGEEGSALRYAPDLYLYHRCIVCTHASYLTRGRGRGEGGFINSSTVCMQNLEPATHTILSHGYVILVLKLLTTAICSSISTLQQAASNNTFRLRAREAILPFNTRGVSDFTTCCLLVDSPTAN